MTPSLVCVVDASVAIKLHLVETLSAEAHALLRVWLTRPQISTCLISFAPNARISTDYWLRTTGSKDRVDRLVEFRQET
jgi:hypothetical protein